MFQVCSVPILFFWSLQMIVKSLCVLPVFFLGIVLLSSAFILSEKSVAQEPVVSIDESADSMLVFSKTAGFRHGSIPEGITCFRELASELGLKFVATEESSVFNARDLASVAVVVFLNTTGDVLDKTQEAAFEAFIRDGGSWLGVHAAADTEYDWPFYGQLVGAYFKSHPAIQPASITVEVRDHPSTRMLPGLWKRTDEWYTYRLSPRKGVTVLASLDEASFSGGGMNGDHPIAWCHEFEGGRALYTGGGHTGASYQETAFREHLKGAVSWLIQVDGGVAAPAAPAAPAEAAEAAQEPVFSQPG
jgi:type 1 glutamine amidotransferase